MSQDRLDGLSMLSIEAEKANQIDQSKVAKKAYLSTSELNHA